MATKFKYQPAPNFSIKSLAFSYRHFGGILQPPYGVIKKDPVPRSNTPESAYLVLDADVDVQLVVHKSIQSIWSCPSPWVVSDAISGKNLSQCKELFAFMETRDKHMTRDLAVQHVVNRLKELGTGALG